MVDCKHISDTVAKGLRDYLKIPVVVTNQNAPMPKYPYLAYTVTILESQNEGTWGVYEDGIDRKPVTQTWSITSNSDDENESLTYAMKARDWLDNIATIELSEEGIDVQSVTAVQSRDNILTSEYEYKKGFDVVFSVMSEVENRVVSTGEYIDTTSITRTEE